MLLYLKGIVDGEIYARKLTELTKEMLENLQNCLFFNNIDEIEWTKDAFAAYNT